MGQDDWKAGYDAWKASETSPSYDPTCDGCGEELHKCVCVDEDDDEPELEPEAVTDEQVQELAAELKEKRLIVGRVEGVLASLEASVRVAGRLGEDPPWLEERRNFAALLRAALGSAT